MSRLRRLRKNSLFLIPRARLAQVLVGPFVWRLILILSFRFFRFFLTPVALRPELDHAPAGINFANRIRFDAAAAQVNIQPRRRRPRNFVFLSPATHVIHPNSDSMSFR